MTDQNDQQPLENVANQGHEQLEEQLKRALADYQNLQKRVEKERQDVVKFANETLLMRMLGIVEGFEMIMKQFQDVLQDNGFEKINIQPGDGFDTQLMEAIDGEGTTVDQVYSYPYKLHDRVVRVGRVTVTNNND